MMRASFLLPLFLLACSEPQEAEFSTESEKTEAPVRDVDEIPVDEGAAAAVGEDDDAPAEGEE